MGWQGLNVLLVEDEAALGKVLGFCLAEAGFQVKKETSGSEAVGLLERIPVDAVVLDLDLQDGSSAILLQQVRAEKDDLLPWVAFSSLDHDTAVARWGPMGSHFLAKPFDPWDLVRRLEWLLPYRRTRLEGNK